MSLIQGVYSWDMVKFITIYDLFYGQIYDHLWPSKIFNAWSLRDSFGETRWIFRVTGSFLEGNGEFVEIRHTRETQYAKFMTNLWPISFLCQINDHFMTFSRMDTRFASQSRFTTTVYTLLIQLSMPKKLCIMIIMLIIPKFIWLLTYSSIKGNQDGIKTPYFGPINIARQSQSFFIGTVHYLRAGGGGDFEGGSLIFGAKNFEKTRETHFSTRSGQK